MSDAKILPHHLTTPVGILSRNQIIKWPSMSVTGFVVQKPTGYYLKFGQG